MALTTSEKGFRFAQNIFLRLQKNLCMYPKYMDKYIFKMGEDQEILGYVEKVTDKEIRRSPGIWKLVIGNDISCEYADPEDEETISKYVKNLRAYIVVFMMSDKCNFNVFELQNNGDYIFEDKNIRVVVNSADLFIDFYSKLEDFEILESRYPCHTERLVYRKWEINFILHDINLQRDLELSFNECLKNPTFKMYHERIGNVLQIIV